MANITRRWKRILAFGCSHGKAIRPDARAAIVEMRRRWKPDTCIHLGDWADMTAFRSGAKGTRDESAPILPDIDSGLRFIEEAGCNMVMAGNHEDRIFRLAHHHNAIIAECANYTMKRIAETLAGLDCVWVDKWPSWRTFGGVKFGHGTLWNENYLRDTAEAYGATVVAHAHRAGVATGRRDDNPQCFGVGTLAALSAEEMGYSKARRSTLAWSAGFVCGEYCDDKAQLWLHDNGQRTEWRLPV